MPSSSPPIARPSLAETSSPPGLGDSEPDSSVGGPSAAVVIERYEQRNWLILAAHLVMLRVGWVFKTESVIIPAFVDAISGAGWLRGSVPLLTRLGYSIPPTLVARRLKNLPLKKWALAGTMAAMGGLASSWGIVWWAAGSRAQWWMPGWFLAFYGLFSAAAGLHQLAFGTVQGKLIRATWRGRLFSVSIALGVVPAIACAWWLMAPWVQRPDGGFLPLFLLTGAAFAVGSVLCFAMVEPPDDYREPARPWLNYFAECGQVLARDRRFALLCLVCALFAAVPILFPHYQALGRQRLGLGGEHLITWIVMQNVALGVFSLAVGWLADRRGNRLALRMLVFGTALTPLAAVLLASMEPGFAGRWFWVVFIPLGLTPLTTKTLINYALEFCPPAEHPRYLSTLNLCQAVPLAGSPLVGWFIDVTSFETVFLGGAGLIALTGLLTFWLYEPRYAAHESGKG